MVNDILLYTGSGVIILWGIAHLIPTKAIIDGFGSISEDNKQIIKMEWIAEGVTLCFIGLIVLLITVSVGSQDVASVIVYWMCGMMLVVMAGLSLLTGANTSIIPIKICPLVKTAVAILFFLASVL